MFKILKITLVFLFFLFFPLLVKATNSLDVVINEIAWMGTEISYSDEWIELYNNTNQTINLEGWVLKAKDGNPTIELAGKIRPNDFYLLERTGDDTLPNILADQIYTGALDNKGEKLELYDNLGNLIDPVDCSSGWFAGDNKTKQTMERSRVRPGSDPDNWQTSENPGGTPKSENSVIQENQIESEIKDLRESGSPPALDYPEGIVINEILPSPEGPDDTEEWIEIFNENNFKVDLSNWKIKDIIGKTKTYIFPKGTKISAKGFLVLKRPISKITLNNDGDGLKLIQPDGDIVDTITYEKAPLGQSYNRTESGWVWKENLTPGAPNITSISMPESKKETKKEENQGSVGKEELAIIGEQFSEKSSSTPLLTALVTSIFSGIIILILKRNLRSKKSDII